MNKNLLNKIALVIGGVCIGSGTTYLIVKNRLVAKYDTILAEEIASLRSASRDEIDHAKEKMKLLRKEPPYDDPRTAVRAYNNWLDELHYLSENGVDTSADEPTPIHDQAIEDRVLQQTEADLKRVEDFKASPEFVDQLLTGATEVVQHEVHPPSQAQKIITLDDVSASPADIPTGNIFDAHPEGSVPVTSLRDQDRPYFITEKEYDDNAEGYQQTTLLYYADDTLADEQGIVIANTRLLLGKDALKNFGYDADNPNTIWVRNDRRKTEFCVVRLDGTHAELVLGIHPED